MQFSSYGVVYRIEHQNRCTPTSFYKQQLSFSLHLPPSTLDSILGQSSFRYFGNYNGFLPNYYLSSQIELHAQVNIMLTMNIRIAVLQYSKDNCGRPGEDCSLPILLPSPQLYFSSLISVTLPPRFFDYLNDDFKVIRIRQLEVKQ